MANPRRPVQPNSKLLPATEVPELRTEQEAAHWYDTHDTSGLPTEPVTEPGPRGEGLETIAVRVSRREIGELKQRADRLGLGYTTYVRMLITRHVLREPPTD